MTKMSSKNLKTISGIWEAFYRRSSKGTKSARRWKKICVKISTVGNYWFSQWFVNNWATSAIKAIHPSKHGFSLSSSIEFFNGFCRHWSWKLYTPVQMDERQSYKTKISGPCWWVGEAPFPMLPRVIKAFLCGVSAIVIYLSIMTNLCACVASLENDFFPYWSLLSLWCSFFHILSSSCLWFFLPSFFWTNHWFFIWNFHVQSVDFPHC